MRRDRRRRTRNPPAKNSEGVSLAKIAPFFVVVKIVKIPAPALFGGTQNPQNAAPVLFVGWSKRTEFPRRPLFMGCAKLAKLPSAMAADCPPAGDDGARNRRGHGAFSRPTRAKLRHFETCGAARVPPTRNFAGVEGGPTGGVVFGSRRFSLPPIPSSSPAITRAGFEDRPRPSGRPWSKLPASRRRAWPEGWGVWKSAGASRLDRV
jgi:hypothetical protein